MSAICKCPKCHELVTIPEGVATDAAVRCPLCRAQYALSVALDAVPPALIPLEPCAPPGGPAETAAPTPTLAEAATDAESDIFVELDAAAEGPGLQPWEDFDAVAEADLEPAKDALPPVKTDLQTLDAGLFGGLATPAAKPPENRKEKQQRGAPTVAVLMPARRRPRSGPLRKLLGVLLGGLLGLVIGYYLLNWIGGPRFDFIEVYLPGVPHTYTHWSK